MYVFEPLVNVSFVEFVENTVNGVGAEIDW